MVAKTSPAILAALFRRFQTRTRAEQGFKISMRRVSEDLLVKERVRRHARAADAPDGPAPKPDANALGRWTNPGDKANWFIPISRVPEVARLLGAGEGEVDALMMVRLNELVARDPEHDAVVAGEWVAKYVQRALALDEEEQAVLDAFRHSRAKTPYTVLDDGRKEQVQAFFESLVQQHLNGLSDDAPEFDAVDVAFEALAPEEQAASRQALRERALAGGQKLAKPPPKLGPLDSAEVVARRFLKSLRQGFRKTPSPPKA